MKTHRTSSSAGRPSRIWTLTAFTAVAGLVLVRLLNPVSAQDAAATAEPAGMTAEIRAIGIDAAAWADPDPAILRSNIRESIQNLARGGFNTAFFQVRETAEVFFPSGIEPWSWRLGAKDPGFDPLKLAIDIAHENDIRLYASVDLLALASCGNPPERTRQSHLYYTHGPDAGESWVCRTTDGEPACPGGFLYLSPAIPEVQAHLRSLLTELLSAYPELDGLYFTKAEYPGPDSSHDPVSVRRYEERGNPDLDYWTDWQRAELTQLLQDLRAQAATLRPGIIVAASVPGVYSRSAFGGNSEVPSAYYDHYVDAVAWVQSGAVDFVVPRISEVLGTAGLEFQPVIENAFEEYTEPRFLAGLDLGRVGSNPEILEQARYAQRTGALGVAALSYQAVADANAWGSLRDAIFNSEALATPLADPERLGKGFVTVVVTTGNGLPVTDAAVRLQRVRGERTTSADGFASFLYADPGEKTLTVSYSGAGSVEKAVTIAAGDVTQAAVHLPGAADVEPPYFEIRDPRDGSETTAEAVNVMGRTRNAQSATVNGEPAELFDTGIFVRDQIPLEMGKNSITVTVTDAEGRTGKRTLEITRVPEPTPTPIPPPFPLFIDKESIQPGEEVRLQPGEPLFFGFRGAPDNIAEFKTPWTDWIRLEEEHERGTFRPLGIYGLNRPFARTEDVTPGNLLFRVRVPEGREVPGGPEARELVVVSDTGISFYGMDRYRLLRVRDDEIGHLMSGVHSVRLGGPYFAELPPHTYLHVTGRRGNFYRVELTDALDAWIPIDEVENASPTEPVPHLSFTSISVQGDEEVDTITIPYSVPVPFRIVPVVIPGERARLEIDFFYAHDAATWISQRPTAKIIRRVSTEQIATDHLRVNAELTIDRIWGYKHEVDGRSLRITVRRPPELAAPPASPLKGLTVAVEAGHGGPRNSGATGVSGTPEKVINRRTADALMEALAQLGATTVNCRVDDESISLSDRVQRAEDANADLFISIHANAGGRSRGYLAVGGTSTYYKWSSAHDFSEAIHRRLLERTGLADFGNVGNFNYTPLRTTWMPAMLVEQAFMSNPEDEAKMLDPAFRQRMVQAIIQGTEDFLNATRTAE